MKIYSLVFKKQNEKNCNLQLVGFKINLHLPLITKSINQPTNQSINHLFILSTIKRLVMFLSLKFEYKSDTIMKSFMINFNYHFFSLIN